MAYKNANAGAAREGSELGALSGAIPTAAVADLGALTATAIAATIPSAAGALTATGIAAAVPSAAPAGGTGATEGAYDTAVNRDAAITTINGLRTHSTDLDLDYEALLVDVTAIRSKLNDLLAKLRTAGIVTA